ncbi:hypothetical protein GW17_00048915 [Ensete ventricosum]|nr:hypothetical protein GW17_00048915 [Ensete ventricosum]
MSEGYPSFSKDLSELSPCWNFIGLGDQPNLNSTNKACNLSSMRDSSRLRFEGCPKTDVVGSNNFVKEVRRRGGQPPCRVGHPGQAAAKASPQGSVHASGGHQRPARKGLPPAPGRKGWLPPAVSPAAFAGAAMTTAQRAARRGLGHPFEKKDDPAPLNFKNSKDYPHVHNSKNTLNNSKNFEDYPLI